MDKEVLIKIRKALSFYNHYRLWDVDRCGEPWITEWEEGIEHDFDDLIEEIDKELEGMIK